MNIRWIVSFALLAAAALPVHGRNLANHGKSGLYSRSIAQVLRLTEKDIDLGTAALLLSVEAGAEINPSRYIGQLDAMAQEVSGRLTAAGIETDARAIPVLNAYLFDECGFSAVDTADNPMHLFLHSVMDGKEGYCLSLSILYLAIGERIGLPLHGVVVPGHFFVRYDDGKIKINIETTSAGNYATDDYYREKFKVPPQTDGIYLRNLSPKESISCFLNNLSNLYILLDDHDSAMKHLENAVRITPGLAMIHTNLGNVYVRSGLKDKGMYEYNRALQLNPLEAKARHNRASLYFELNRFEDAAADYREAVELDPNFVDSYRGLAQTYTQQKLFDQARTQIHRAISLEPQSASLYGQLGDIEREAGRLHDARTAYLKSLQLDPDGIRYHYGLAATLARLGDVENETAVYRQMLVIPCPDDMLEYRRIALFNLGNLDIAAKRYSEAVDHYRLALQIKPDDPTALFNIGVALMNLSKYAEAADCYRLVIAGDPANGEAFQALATAQYYLGIYDQAWQNIEKARLLGVGINAELYEFLANQARQAENVH